MAADKISIGDSCMFGHGACITDADWHGIYDRTKVVGDPKPVVLEENVWVGEDAMICKGVRIGKNSIIGARSVVTKDVPNNTIYAGNPATFIRNLDEGEFITRKDFFKDPTKLAHDFDLLDQYSLGNNSLWGLIKSIVWRDKSHLLRLFQIHKFQISSKNYLSFLLMSIHLNILHMMTSPQTT
jgi:hypothetical protein